MGKNVKKKNIKNKVTGHQTNQMQQIISQQTINFKNITYLLNKIHPFIKFYHLAILFILFVAFIIPILISI